MYVLTRSSANSQKVLWLASFLGNDWFFHYVFGLNVDHIVYYRVWICTCRVCVLRLVWDCWYTFGSSYCPG